MVFLPHRHIENTGVSHRNAMCLCGDIEKIYVKIISFLYTGIRTIILPRMKFLGIIPARYASTRLPGKPLASINGKTMIERVYIQAGKAKKLSDVLVATDDQRIFNFVSFFGGKVVMTSGDHQSGTDRCAEVVKRTAWKNYDVVINIQGDEPFIDPKQIDLLCSCFRDRNVQIATLAIPLQDGAGLQNPNVPKVIIGRNRNAIYFSRAAVPFLRGKDPSEWTKQFTYYKHIGIYAYRTKTLRELTRLKRSPLELAESLEQLRWLENGYPIRVQVTKHQSISIDTPEDLEKAKKLFANS